MADAAARGVARGAGLVNGEKRHQLVTEAGAMLGCDFCATYSKPVGVAKLHLANNAFPASVCRSCAIEVAVQLHRIVNSGAGKL